MTTNTSKTIIEFITKNTQASPKDLYTMLGISPRAVFKQLQKLCEKNVLQKVGQPPKVYYILATTSPSKQSPLIDETINTIINENFYYVSALGQEALGKEGFEQWCHKHHLDITKTAGEYVQILAKYHHYKKNGFIDGLPKITSTFKSTSLNHLYYLDFYAIERFGKTKLGQLVLLAKSGQSKKHLSQLITHIASPINTLIERFNIDGVGFIPPTVKRNLQLMDELKKQLSLASRLLSIIKIKTPVTIAQKTLSKLEDRIENARQTLIVEDKASYNNILLIDDAVGSGATLNETATQIRNKNLCTGKIIGLAIVGSFKGFDVISEV